MSLTLVNLFTVPPGEEDAFAARFSAVVEKLEGMPGFEGTELHRNAGVGDPSYAFVNIASVLDLKFASSLDRAPSELQIRKSTLDTYTC